jgi:hypothetical protein
MASPTEADWGQEFGYGGAAVAGEIIARAEYLERDHLRILIPELLLACALGKFDPAGEEFVVAYATSCLDTLTDPEVQAPVVVGLAAVASRPEPEG